MKSFVQALAFMLICSAPGEAASLQIAAPMGNAQIAASCPRFTFTIGLEPSGLGNSYLEILPQTHGSHVISTADDLPPPLQAQTQAPYADDSYTGLPAMPTLVQTVQFEPALEQSQVLNVQAGPIQTVGQGGLAANFRLTDSVEGPAAVGHALISKVKPFLDRGDPFGATAMQDL